MYLLHNLKKLMAHCLYSHYGFYSGGGRYARWLKCIISTIQCHINSYNILKRNHAVLQIGVWRRAFNGNQEGSEHLHLYPIQPRQQYGIQHQENLIENTVLNNNEYKDKSEAYPNIFNLLTDVAFRNKGFVQENLERLVFKKT